MLNMNNELTFGDYVIDKRKEKELSARQLAMAIGISPVYMEAIFEVSKQAMEIRLQKANILS